MTPAAALQIAVAFTWLGLVLGISFLEAPIKFRAPGITVELGVGIGRLVFRALNLVEALAAVILLVTVAVRLPDVSGWTVALVIAVCVVLAIGAGVLRPLMDRRVRGGQTADAMPRHRLHYGYIGLEVAKVALLVAIGVLGFG